jgi:hypothetical protein
VLAFGAIAYVQAIRADGVFQLVEEASAFGSAGVLVAASFALFTTFGGRWAAGTTLLAGISMYFGSMLAGFEFPFLASLAASLAAYVVIGMAERFVVRLRHA